MRKFRLTIIVLIALAIATLSFSACTKVDNNLYTITIHSTEGGTISSNTISAKAGSEIQLNLTPNVGYRLVESSLVIKGSKAYGMGFTMPAENIQISAKFEKIKNINSNIPFIDKESKTVYFGEYPQSLACKDAVDLMSTSANSQGYYVSSYDNARYVKAIAKPFNDKYYFSNGIAIKKDTEYYFKVEPIKWLILNEKVNTYTLFSDYILDNGAMLESKNYKKSNFIFGHDYNIRDGVPEKTYANKYEASDMRAFLNGEFAKLAFSNNALLLDTQNDNITTNNTNNKYAKAQANTIDKVYLLSHADIINADYGFDTKTNTKDSKRLSIVSDYARCNGAWLKTSQKQIFDNGQWWIRSSGKESGWYEQVNGYGIINTSGLNAYKEMIGVRPAITIKGA